MVQFIRGLSIKVKLIVTIGTFLFFSSTALGTISFNYAVGNFSNLFHGHGVGLFNQTLHANANQLLTVMLVTIAVELIVGGLGAYWISLQITKPMSELLSRVDRVSSGDLTGDLLTLKQRDEIGRLAEGFNHMFVSLKTVIGDAIRASQHLASSSEQLSASADQSSKAAEHAAVTIQDLASGIDDQSRSVKQSKEAILHITDEMTRIAENSTQVSVSAADASEKVMEGTHAVAIARQQVDTIHDSVADLATIAGELDDGSKEIGHIVEMITGIASQTKLLSLNSAIEAARAGEYGRGFAVVANEVRKLADQSGESAKQIETLIRKIQEQVGHIANFVTGLKGQMARGLSAMSDASDSFEQIRWAIDVVSCQISEVSTAVQNTTADTQRLKQAFVQVAEVTEQTATAMQEIAAASEEQLASMEEIAASASTLTSMAEQLEDDIGKFTL